MNLRLRLLIFSIGSVVLVSVGMSFTYLFIAKSAIVQNFESQMNNIRDSKKKNILTYFQNKKSDMIALDGSLDITTSLFEFRKAYRTLAAKSSRAGAESYLQEKYIFSNPNPIGKKEQLDDALDGSDYSKVHRKFHSYFRRYIKQKYFYDLFIVDLDGTLLYTVFKENDYATNLLDGKYKDTNIGKLFKRARSANDPSEVLFADFENYPPSNNDPASFIALPIIVGGRTEGVLMAQMPIDEINEAMHDGFLGDNGAVYLIGKDNLFRTADHRFKNEDFILRKRNDSPVVTLAFNEVSGVKQDVNYRGESVFTAFTPIEIMGTKYALISEYETDSALLLLNEIKVKILIAFLVLISVVVLVTFFVARAISTPIIKAVTILSSSTREIAATVEQQEKTAQMQSASVNETSTTMAELGSSAKHTAEQSQTVTEKSREAQETAKEGSHRISEMVHSMEELKDKVLVISDQILHLSEKNNQIGNIIGLVSDIANQTNMLALNAAVEAARAGEYGKGFAVVAGEIRKLADESKRSAEKIQDILSEIKKATDSTVMAAEEGNKKVDRSAILGNEVVRSFEGVFQSISAVFTSTEQITLNVKQQSIAINEVVQAMTSLNRGAGETATGITQTKLGIQQVKEATLSLKQTVDGKKITIV
ncbi:methyl-accepting chemotaxis protein [Leptospira idonii]|nr:methyl-accepting chemotaxis protein [Leptospira idonii]